MCPTNLAAEKSSMPRYILLPALLNLPQQKLKYLDALVYTALRSFENKHAIERKLTKENRNEEATFPAITTIAARAGLAKATVTASIRRLKAAGLIRVTESPRNSRISNRYWFPELDSFYTIPCDLLRCEELTSNEKAMLICLRQFYIGEELICMFTEVITEIAKHLGVSYRTVHAQYTSLVAKGYITDSKQLYKENYQRRVLRMSDKLQWVFKPAPQIDYSKPVTFYKRQDGKWTTEVIDGAEMRIQQPGYISIS